MAMQYLMPKEVLKKEAVFAGKRALEKYLDEKLHIQPMYKSNQKCPNSLEIFNRPLALPGGFMQSA